LETFTTSGNSASSCLYTPPIEDDVWEEGEGGEDEGGEVEAGEGEGGEADRN
jgi:hypothetical protein